MRKEKQLHLNEIQKPIAGSNSFIVVRYKMGANTANSFRRELGKVGSQLEVTRKRLLLKAAKESGFDLKYNSLEGHIGVVLVSCNPLDVTKLVFKFGQDNSDSIEVVGAALMANSTTAPTWRNYLSFQAWMRCALSFLAYLKHRSLNSCHYGCDSRKRCLLFRQ